MCSASSTRVVGQLVRSAIIAGGSIFAVTTTAAAIEMPANIGRALNDPTACWVWEKSIRLPNGGIGWVGSEDNEDDDSGEITLTANYMRSAISQLATKLSPDLETVEGQTYIYVKNEGGESLWRYARVRCPESYDAAGWFAAAANVDFANVYSATKFTSPTDTLKIHSDTNQIQLSGQANVGRWFVSGLIGFAGAPGGGLTDMFPAFPAANFSGTVNSGSVYNFVADGGYNFIQQPDLRVGVFAGYYSFSEYLSGMIGGGSATAPLLSDHWQGARAGVNFDWSFLAGNAPIDVKASAAAMPLVELQSGGLFAHGGGAALHFDLSFPIPNLPLRGHVFVQDDYMNVSGISFGAPMNVKNNNVTYGVGLNILYSELKHFQY